MTFGEFIKTEDYEWSDVVYIFDEDGMSPELNDDWPTDETEVVKWEKYNEPASLEIIVRRIK